MPASQPITNATMPHKKTIGRFETKLKSASIKGSASAQSNPQTITRLTSHAIKLIRAASINKDLRNKVSELPNTFCVLMLLIRNGVREVLKFVKLIAATMTIRRAIPNNKAVTSLFPLPECTTVLRLIHIINISQRDEPDLFSLMVNLLEIKMTVEIIGNLICHGRIIKQ